MSPSKNPVALFSCFYFGDLVERIIETLLLPNDTMSDNTPATTRAEVLKAITEYYELGDLSFIETVNNITYGYKVEMKQNLTKQHYGENKGD